MSKDSTGRGSGSGFAMPVLTAMVFLGATLLFGMEPLVGRMLVSYFGGAAHVWLTSLMFFQAMLLVGYLYAHLLARRLGRWHLLLLLLPLVNLPLSATTRAVSGTPLLALLGVLLAHFALPFSVLATTAVVAQSWLARSSIGQGHEPYPLYAASNAGSLLALFGYAFLAEPLLGVKAQSSIWTAGYMIYAALVLAAWFTLRPLQEPSFLGTEKHSGLQPEAAPAARHYAWWLLLSALPSGFLLTVTNFIALEVGSFPMVWVFPLALYLGSFVVTFRSNGGVPRFLRAWWLEVVLLGFLVYLLPMGWVGWFVVVIAPLLVFLAVCLIAHGELFESRPPVSYLTHYYLTMAVGGFLGGALVSLLAPYIFSGLYEYPIILAGLACLFWWCCPPMAAFALPYWPAVLRRLRGLPTGLILGLTLVCFIGQVMVFQEGCKFRHRNFYGTYQITDKAPSTFAPAGIRMLIHGKTYHGAQLLTQEQQRTPIFYYYRGGGISTAFESKPAPRRIAVIGLGAGVVSAYLRPGDNLTYFEIDPDNEKIARDWFTFLEDAGNRVRVVPGDGRLSLKETAKGINYDLIAIDAFTGDGIPTHLLTREAIGVYLDRLSPNGIILFHISNRYYDLRPILKAAAAQLHLSGAMNIPDQTQLHPYEISPQCVVLARGLEPLQSLLDRGWEAFRQGDDLPDTTLWTDDYINILAPLWAHLWPHPAGTSPLIPAARAGAIR